MGIKDGHTVLWISAVYALGFATGYVTQKKTANIEAWLNQAKITQRQPEPETKPTQGYLIQVAESYKGVVTGIDEEHHYMSSKKITFTLNGKVFCSPNQYGQRNYSETSGPGGMTGLAARLDSARNLETEIEVTSKVMPDGSHSLSRVKFGRIEYVITVK